MNCREFVDFLMDYLDESLPGGQRRAFEAHIEDCPGCGVYLATYRETVRLGKQACDPDGPIPEEVPETLIEAIRAARETQG